MIDGIPPSALEHRPAIVRAAQFYFGIPAPVPLIAGQIMQESHFNPSARSGVGASGLMQFMPSTAKWVGEEIKLPAAPLDAGWSIRAGVWYDAFLYRRTAGATECDRWMFALSAYNGGEKRVRQRKALSPDPASWTATGQINPGIAPANQRENENYGPRIVYRWQPVFVSWGRSICLR